MKQMYSLVGLTIVHLVVACVPAHGGTPNTPKAWTVSVGVTNVTERFDGAAVDLRLTIRDVSSSKDDYVLRACTGSRTPCTLLESIEIKVDGKPIFVPRSVLYGVSDPTRITVDKHGRNYRTVLAGGDAAESYQLAIEFDSNRVLMRQLFSSLDKGKPLETTTYEVVVIGE